MILQSVGEISVQQYQNNFQHCSLCFVVSVEVDEDADVDGADGGQDADQSHGSKLVDELDADEDDEADDAEQDGAVEAVVVELDGRVHDVSAGYRHRGADEIGLWVQDQIIQVTLILVAELNPQPYQPEHPAQFL